MIGEFNDKNKFPVNLFVTDRQVSRLCKVFLNNSSANTKLSKSQLSIIAQSG